MTSEHSLPLGTHTSCLVPLPFLPLALGMTIDLRSDTVTRPTAAMKEAMHTAAVGDDVFGDDPSINALQDRVAALFGMEAGLFFPSGTMANQIAIQTYVGLGDEVVCDQLAHVYKYEGGGIAAHSGASVRLLQGQRGIFSAEDVALNINADDPHFPATRLVSLENTMNRGGGACWPDQAIREIYELTRTQQLGMHLDGARLWNAIVKTGTPAHFYGSHFDSISLCFSKGLGCPVGSVLIGSADRIRKAHRIRKRFGGGMRQAGSLAAACTFALDHHLSRLADDHQHAAQIGNILEQQSAIKQVLPVETNIVLFETHTAEKAAQLLQLLKAQDIHASHTGGAWVRFTFHLDVDAEKAAQLSQVLPGILNSL